MSWREDPRLSFTHVSTHQTYVGKALYEHAPDCATIAAVACMSSSLLKSSLGPNLLALIRVDDDTFDLFDKIFLEYNPHMQLTQKLNVMFLELDHSTELIRKLKAKGPLLSSSLLQAKINLLCSPLFEGFRALESLEAAGIDRSELLTILKSLPSLSELTLLGCSTFDAAFFNALGDLENNKNLTSLTILSVSCQRWCSQGFQNDFCGRLLSKNRLTKMDVNPRFWGQMNGADEEAFVNAGMTNLVELRERVPAKFIRGDAFANLRFLSVVEVSDVDLVNIGNQCLFLEVLVAGAIRATGSFLRDDNLVKDAFKHLRELLLDYIRSGFDVGNGFSRFVSLEKISISPTFIFDGDSLQHLPNPDCLRSISIVGGNSSMSNLHRFVNLEEIDLNHFRLSRDDILSFALFKQLNRIKLIFCGEDTASSEPFRILCPQLPKLEALWCFGSEVTRWTEEDVETILVECKRLRELRFDFKDRALGSRPFSFQAEDDHRKRISRINKKYSCVNINGQLQKKTAVEQESGSRREREE